MPMKGLGDLLASVDTYRPNERYARQMLLPELGTAGQRRLNAARVLVVGAGGLGSPVIQYLAAAGIGTLGVIDDDVVEESNLHRQVIHRLDDVGLPKVDSAARRVAEIAGDLVAVERHGERLTADNAREVLGAYDIIVDGADNFPTRYLVSDVAAELNRPVVWGSILGFDAQVSLFWANPPGSVGVTLRDLFPLAPPPGSVPSCGEAGVMGALCGQAGSLMAMEVLKVAATMGKPLLGRVVVINALDSTFREIALRGGQGQPDLDFTRPVASAPAPLVPPPSISAQSVLSGHGVGIPVDVRELSEFQAGHLPGAIHLPLSGLDARAVGLLPPGPLMVYCQVGPRAAAAARQLGDLGVRDVTLLDGSLDAWLAAGGPIEMGEPRNA